MGDNAQGGRPRPTYTRDPGPMSTQRKANIWKLMGGGDRDQPGKTVIPFRSGIKYRILECSLSTPE